MEDSEYPGWADYVCPPVEAKPFEGVLYMFASGRTDSKKSVGDSLGEDATLRSFEKKSRPEGFVNQQQECQAHGLSCFKTEDDALMLPALVAAARRWPLAEVHIHSGQGVIMHTPGGHSKHCTWWSNPYRLVPDGRIILDSELQREVNGEVCDAC